MKSLPPAKKRFRSAALDLDMLPTAIGKAVASLEKRLGVRLFNRTTRNVALTSAGREYVEAMAPAMSDIHNATEAIAEHGRKPTGDRGAQQRRGAQRPRARRVPELSG
jgi:DNA-binding transcriptional LysR family regulator